MRLEVFGSEHLAKAYEEHGQAILAFWHNRLLLLPFIYRYRMHLKNIVVMVSRSRDGEFVANFLDRFGFHTIRGSSSKGGGQTFTQAIKMARKGYDIAITPDGPRGPRYQVQPGVIKLAQMTSLPIVPAAYQASSSSAKVRAPLERSMSTALARALRSKTFLSASAALDR